MTDEQDQSQDLTPLKSSVALQYDRQLDPAPTIVASGKGLIAERILEIAREHDIPIREDADLVQVLAKLDLGEAIPGDLYPVIAEVFAFVYRLNAEKGRTENSGSGDAVAS